MSDRHPLVRVSRNNEIESWKHFESIKVSNAKYKIDDVLDQVQIYCNPLRVVESCVLSDPGSQYKLRPGPVRSDSLPSRAMVRHHFSLALIFVLRLERRAVCIVATISLYVIAFFESL